MTALGNQPVRESVSLGRRLVGAIFGVSLWFALLGEKELSRAPIGRHLVSQFSLLFLSEYKKSTQIRPAGEYKVSEIIKRQTLLFAWREEEYIILACPHSLSLSASSFLSHSQFFLLIYPVLTSLPVSGHCTPVDRRIYIAVTSFSFSLLPTRNWLVFNQKTFFWPHAQSDNPKTWNAYRIVNWQNLQNFHWSVEKLTRKKIPRLSITQRILFF